MSDFKDMMVRDVTFTYPRLDSAYLYNSVERKSEKCSTTTPQAAWSCGFTVSKEEAVRIWGDAKDHYNECKSRSKDSKMGDFKTVHSYKQNEDGTITFGTKKKCMSSKGTPNKEVRVIDGQKKDLEDRAFWSGSTGNIAFTMLPTFNPSKNEWGISFLLNAVQVVDAIYQEAQDDFDVVGEASSASADPFDAPKPAAPAADPFGLPPTGSDAPVKEDLDDEIPF
jgi:hypothetical protein